MSNTNGKNGNEKTTICWGCARALRIFGVSCPWSQMFNPVPGWTAIRKDIQQKNVPGKKRAVESYIVIKCPLFLSDDDYNKLSKDKEKVTMNQSINTSNTTKMDRFDKNTKGSIPEITIKEKSITLPKTDDFAHNKQFVVYISRDGTRIELEEGKDGFLVSATGYGGNGRMIKCEVACDAMKKRGTVIPQTIPLQQTESGLWFAELKTEAVEG